MRKYHGIYNDNVQEEELNEYRLYLEQALIDALHAWMSYQEHCPVDHSAEIMQMQQMMVDVMKMEV